MAREMKDSGIEWIGEIPEDWEIIQVKRLFKIGRGRVIAKTELSDKGYPVYSSQTKNNGILGYIDTYDFDRSQLTWTTDGANAGTVFLREGKHNCTNVCGTLMPYTIENNLKYLKYILEYIAIFHKRADINGYKIMNNEMANIHIVLPERYMQDRIVSYLDKQCNYLNNILEKTRASIEEYKKLKQAVITQAVTKGIRDNREMKDSENKWAGEIPSDIKISRVGLHYEIILGKMLCTSQIDDTYTYEPYFCAADIHFEGIAENERKKMWFSPLEKQQYLVRKDDLLVVEGGAGAGGCAVAPIQEMPTYIQNSIMIVRPEKSADVRYLKYWIECLVKQGYIDVVCNKATIPHFTKDKLANVPFLVFSIQEQEEIADYLDSKCSAIDDLIAKKEQYLSEIENYKKSLIYEYVTGKKEVPQEYQA